LNLRAAVLIVVSAFQRGAREKKSSKKAQLTLSLSFSFFLSSFSPTGFGCDGHGQDSTKAAVRAARNSIEFNSIPSIRRLVPGGYENLKLHVKIGVPHPEKVEKQQVAKVFPYGEAEVEVVEGGLSAGSGIAIASLGDTSDEMVIAVCAVTVGFFDADKEAKKEMKEKEGEKEGEGCGGGDAPKHAGYCE
jgi:uncharacterized protein (TIGR02058 family)